jgi:hypothetical protein
MYIMHKLINKFVAVVDGWIEESNINHMKTALKEILRNDTCNEIDGRPSNKES